MLDIGESKQYALLVTTVGLSDTLWEQYWAKEKKKMKLGQNVPRRTGGSILGGSLGVSLGGSLPGDRSGSTLREPYGHYCPHTFQSSHPQIPRLLTLDMHIC